MSNSQIVRQFWTAMKDKKYDALQTLFVENAKIQWPNTQETFTVSEFIHVNSVYPGNWEIELETIDEFEEKIVSVVRIYSTEENVSLHANSHFTFSAGKIVTLKEYYSTDSIPPKWRQINPTS